MVRIDLDALISGWRGPLLAALIAVLAGLPSLFLVPILDRQEARVVQTTADRIEAGRAGGRSDGTLIPDSGPLVHVLQAAAVTATSDVDARDIRPYRLPSLLGAALAAWACAWGAAALWGPRIGFVAGALLATTYLLSTLAGVATAQALGAGAVTLMMAALGRIYVGAREGGTTGRPVKLMLWLGLAGSLLTTGLAGVLILGLTAGVLAVLDRDARFLRRLGWSWGPVVLALALGPWIVAATVATDGEVWRALWQETAAGRIGRGAAEWSLPGSHLLIAPLLLFPATLMAPAAVMTGITRRAEPGVRFALAWLAPAWILFELSPDKDWAQTLPLFAAATWLAAASLTRPLGRRSRLIGVALAGVGGAYVLAATLYGLSEFGGEASRAWATPTIGLSLAAAGVGGFLLFHRLPVSAILASIGLGMLAHAALAGVVRTLEPLSVSPRLSAAMRDTGLHPVAGRYPGPVAIAGYDQPSAVFLLGPGARLTDERGAAEAIAEGRTAVVDESLEAGFRAALTAVGAGAERRGEIAGLDYVKGEPVALTLYAPEAPGARR